MLSATQAAGSGSSWMAGVSGATRMPSDGIGGVIATVTNADIPNSFAFRANVVIAGVMVTTASAGTGGSVAFLSDSGGGGGAAATITALYTFTTNSVGFYSFGPEGIRVSNKPSISGTNVVGSIGLTLPGVVVATLIFKVLQ